MTPAAPSPDSPPPWLTVAICTWNRCELLRQTLEQFTHVRQPAPPGWELIVVDNNCTDQTEAVIGEFVGRLPIRRVFEPKPGQSNARNRAVNEAKGKYILWTDDDVLVGEDWLVDYAEAFHVYPEYALFGGPITPWFPSEPARWLRRAMGKLEPVFALCNHGEKPIDLSPNVIPYGANYALRLDVQRELPYDPQLGRKGKGMMGSDETELYSRFFARGLKGRWVPSAKVRHFIPPDRQTWDYLYRYYHGVGMTSEFLRLRETTEGRESLICGAPRWLWRHALVCEVKFWVRRLVLPIEIWIGDFQSRSRAWGRLAAYRQHGKS